MRHVMVDLETLDTAPTAAITSIGAVEFNPESNATGRTFFQNVDADSAIRSGGTVSGACVYWWMQQCEEARLALLSPAPRNIEVVLREFIEWMPLKVVLWCHTSFDEPVLRHAMQGCQLHEPWRHRDMRDVRTVVDFAGVWEEKVTKPENFVKHNALHDALHQVRLVQTAYALRGLTASGPA